MHNTYTQYAHIYVIKHYLVRCPNLIYLGTAARARGLAVPAHTHTSLSLSLCVSSVKRVAPEEQHFQLNTDIMFLL